MHACQAHAAPEAAGVVWDCGRRRREGTEQCSSFLSQEDTSGAYADLIGIPKALLPATPGGPEEDTILDHWWTLLKSRQQFREVYLVTNAAKCVCVCVCVWSEATRYCCLAL